MSETCTITVTSPEFLNLVDDELFTCILEDVNNINIQTAITTTLMHMYENDDHLSIKVSFDIHSHNRGLLEFCIRTSETLR